jgi:hypothetical protein
MNKERGILFSAPMVRAIQEGRKTMTRRIMKPQPSEDWSPFAFTEIHKMKDGEFVMKKGVPVPIGWGVVNEDGDEGYVCPYGKPGDFLWIRETWAVLHKFNNRKPNDIPHGARIYYKATDDVDDLLLRPSIHMPRWASRITLEITDIRCERLQDISEEDALAEGMTAEDTGHGNMYEFMKSPAVYNFSKLWASIYGWDSWLENHWLLVIEFKVLENSEQAKVRADLFNEDAFLARPELAGEPFEMEETK